MFKYIMNKSISPQENFNELIEDLVKRNVCTSDVFWMHDENFIYIEDEDDEKDKKTAN